VTLPPKRLLRLYAFAGAVLYGTLLATPAQAQTISERLLAHSAQSVSITGSAGITGEAYTTSGNSRRPPLSARSFLRASVNLYGIRTGFNLLYSTEENRIRQSLNRLGFEATWRWIKVGAGDTQPRFSDFSLSGLQLRGGTIDASPGVVRLGFARGTTQRATEIPGDNTLLSSQLAQSAYRRDVTAVRIGLGDVASNHFHLIGMTARDDTLAVRLPSAGRPEENLSLTSLAGVNLFERRFTLALEGTVSAHNRDLFAREIDTDTLLDPDSTALPAAVLPIARLLTSLFTPTVSTSVGYAVQARTSIRVRSVNVRGQYKRIGPGFTSLGIFSVRNDLVEWRVRPNIRLLNGRGTVALNYGQSRNNLSNQRATSRRRDQLGLNARAQFTPFLSVGTSFQQGSSEVSPEIDRPALRRTQTTQNVTLNPTLIVKRGSRTHTFSLSTAFRRFTDGNSNDGADTLKQATSDFRNANASLSWFGNVAASLNVHATLNLLQNRSTSDTDVLGLNAGASGDFLDRKLNLGLTLGATSTRSTGLGAAGAEVSLVQLTANLTGGVRIARVYQLRLSVRAMRSQSSGSGLPSFNEVRSQFNFSRSF
jgi:hypothetical protein